MSVPAGQLAYYKQVWSFVRQVPTGKVVTYGQIAQSLPEPLTLDIDEQALPAARLVGSAMAASPADVPWHRVINSQGKVSNRPEANKQVQLLEAEGLSFLQGRIDLNQHQWHGSNQADQPKLQQLF